LFTGTSAEMAAAAALSSLGAHHVAIHLGGNTAPRGSIGSDCDPVNVPHPLPPPGRVGDPDSCSIGPSINKPPSANCDPVACNNQKPGLFKLPIGPLALPGGKGRRIAAEIGNKLYVVALMTKGTSTSSTLAPMRALSATGPQYSRCRVSLLFTAHSVG
jgi:hypothetical protein